ncbi:MAG: PhoD-like phosphatase N-terminal domain-containing protein [Solirubrobacterales bacterium]|nr:PhoD-like phosphatase N-terminal domain-containing protein [Solirubrobacterales bacterium]
MLKIRAGLAPSALLLILAGVLAFSPGATAKPKGFSFGTATGDVSAKSAIFWARANRQGKTRIKITGLKHRFGKCSFRKAAKRFIVKAKKSNNLTVQKKVGHLRPNTKYKYRFYDERTAERPWQVQDAAQACPDQNDPLCARR